MWKEETFRTHSLEEVVEVDYHHTCHVEVVEVAMNSHNQEVEVVDMMNRSACLVVEGLVEGLEVGLSCHIDIGTADDW